MQVAIFFWSVHVAAFLLVSVLLVYHIHLIYHGKTTFESNRLVLKIYISKFYQKYTLVSEVKSNDLHKKNISIENRDGNPSNFSVGFEFLQVFVKKND